MALKLDTAVKAMVLERIMPYPVRLEARKVLTAGTRVAFDLRGRLHGTLEVSDDREAPVRTVVCPAVVAAAAVELKVSPAKLAEALTKAAAQFTVRGAFVGEEFAEEDDPHVQAIAAVDEAVIKGLRPVLRNAAIRVTGRRTWYVGSTIDGKAVVEK